MRRRVNWFRLKGPRLRLYYGLALSALAFLWRRLMFRTTFIAVTGSIGKTTATECLAAILSSRFPANATRHGRSGRRDLASTILRTRWKHRFTVIEVGTNLAGALQRAAWMIAPDTVVVLAVAGVHTHHFATLEDIAREKSQLLSRLGSRGVAILNGDDPRVAAMAVRCRGKVVTFGRAPESDVWASEVSSVWPARLSFRIHRGSESREVKTKLVGEHWLNSVLATLAAGSWHGIDLASAVSAIEQIEPVRGRMEPVRLPSGAYLLRDDFNASFAGLPAALRVLEQAPGRRVLVINGGYDSGLNLRARFQLIGQMAARSADLVVLFGNESRRAANAMAEAGMKCENVRSFPDLWAVAEFLKSELGEGDLVLLRDCYQVHAERIYFAQLGTVGCRKPVCSRRHILCDHCPDLRPGLENATQAPEPVRPFWQPL